MAVLDDIMVALQLDTQNILLFTSISSNELVKGKRVQPSTAAPLHLSSKQHRLLLMACEVGPVVSASIWLIVILEDCDIFWYVVGWIDEENSAFAATDSARGNGVSFAVLFSIRINFCSFWRNSSFPFKPWRHPICMFHRWVILIHAKKDTRHFKSLDTRFSACWMFDYLVIALDLFIYLQRKHLPTCRKNSSPPPVFANFWPLPWPAAVISPSRWNAWIKAFPFVRISSGSWLCVFYSLN